MSTYYCQSSPRLTTDADPASAGASPRCQLEGAVSRPETATPYRMTARNIGNDGLKIAPERCSLWPVKGQFWRRCGQTSDGPLGLRAGSYQAMRCRGQCWSGGPADRSQDSLGGVPDDWGDQPRSPPLQHHAGTGPGRSVGTGAFHPDPAQRAEAAEPGVQIGEPDRGRQERLDAERPAVGVERSGNVNVQVGVTPPVIWRVSTMVIAIPALFNVG